MNLEDLVEKLRIDVAPDGHHHSRAGWIQVDCPYCSAGSRRWRLGICIANGVTNCWMCGRHRLKQTLVQLSNDWQLVNKHFGDVDFDFSIPDKKAGGKLILPDGVAEMLPAHRRFLKKRGFHPEHLIRLWELMGIGISSTMGWRILVPIYYYGRLVSWTTRGIHESQQRWLSAKPEQEVICHKDILYGMEYCRHACVVHEGPSDVWNVGPGSVCTFGTDYTTEQVCKIASYPIRAICFDSTPEAQARANELADLLEPLPGETHVVELDAEDPGSASKREVRKLRKAFLE